MSAPVKNRKAWRDRPDVVLVSIRRSDDPVFNRATARWDTKITLTYTVIGTREMCERENGGAPVDPGVYGPETILTAWDLGLSQRQLENLSTSRTLLLHDSAHYRWSRRYEAKLARAVAVHIGICFCCSSFTGISGRGRICIDLATV